MNYQKKKKKAVVEKPKSENIQAIQETNIKVAEVSPFLSVISFHENRLNCYKGREWQNG